MNFATFIPMRTLSVGTKAPEFKSALLAAEEGYSKSSRSQANIVSQPVNYRL